MKVFFINSFRYFYIYEFFIIIASMEICFIEAFPLVHFYWV